MDTVNIQLLSAYDAVKPCDGTMVPRRYFRRADVYHVPDDYRELGSEHHAR